MAVEFIEYPNGRRKLVFEGYIFVKQKELNGGVISWECCERRNSKSCRAKVKTLNGVFQGRTNHHTCTRLPNPAKVEVAKALAAMRMQAGRSDDRTQAIVGANVENLSDVTKAYLPSVEAMKRGIRRVRQGRNPLAPLPENHGFVIPPEFRTLTNDELFLQHDNQDDNGRILIFGSSASLSFLEQAND